MRTVILLNGWLMLLVAPALAGMPEQIGSWLLTCPSGSAGAGSCLLRAEKRFLDQGGLTGELEIMAAGKSLVPVVTVRGLSTDALMAASLAGKTEATLQFGGGPKVPLECAASTQAYLCAPTGDAIRTLAASLPSARAVTVRVSVTVNGLKPLPVQEKSLELSGTNEALARLRLLGPSKLPVTMQAAASQSPEGLMGMADKALKAAGYQNGTADLQALVAKYRGK